MKNLKKIFVSYRFSGEDINELKIIIDKITNTIRKKRYDFFCSLYKEDYFKEKKLSRKQIYDFCNQNIVDSDIVFFFVKKAKKSEGMELELNQAIEHKKKIILAIKDNLNFSDFRKSAHDIIEYKNLEQFYKILGQYDFEKKICK